MADLKKSIEAVEEQRRRKRLRLAANRAEKAASAPARLSRHPFKPEPDQVLPCTAAHFPEQQWTAWLSGVCPPLCFSAVVHGNKPAAGVGHGTQTCLSIPRTLALPQLSGTCFRKHDLSPLVYNPHSCGGSHERPLKQTPLILHMACVHLAASTVEREGRCQLSLVTAAHSPFCLNAGAADR